MPSHVQCYDELINHRREVSSPISSGCCHFFWVQWTAPRMAKQRQASAYITSSAGWDWLIFFVAYDWGSFFVRSWMRTNDGSVH